MRTGACGEEGCDRIVHARGVCSMHYRRAWRARNLSLVPRREPDRPMLVLGLLQEIHRRTRPEPLVFSAHFVAVLERWAQERAVS